ncbi:hypothetical protein [Legionella qingyii]|uniref:hypothetical protein n=1 Tax=Legionella qingyii TaxID=2184757 RepID=UPI001F33E9BC|nr:hypothetical protein [Legionella qingyii]
MNGIKTGILEKLQGGTYQFTYLDGYHNVPVSLTTPLFEHFSHNNYTDYYHPKFIKELKRS